jgi:hypothetical protein
MMVDLGGVTGFWLGLAIMSFFEIFEFLVDTLLYSLHRIITLK